MNNSSPRPPPSSPGSHLGGCFLTIPCKSNFFTIFFPIVIYSPYTSLSPPQSPHRCPCPWVLLPFCLVPPPLTSPLHRPIAVSLLSMSLSPLCLLVQFVHQIPHMNEIIWYLSFSDWLISLSIMFFRPKHAVQITSVCGIYLIFYVILLSLLKFLTFFCNLILGTKNAVHI